LEAEESFSEQDITFFGQVVNANFIMQEILVVLDYERISVNASQALTEANKVGPCLEPWNETVETWFVYVLILSFDQSIPHSSMAQLFHTFQLPHQSPLGSPIKSQLSSHPSTQRFIFHTPAF
jgi:hypothetical protein